MSILTGPQIDQATAFQAARSGVDTIVWKIQNGLAEAARILVLNCVAWNRTAIVWNFGEKVTIFLSEQDANKVNGFYFSWLGVEPYDIRTSGVNALIGNFGCQYLYQYSFGTDTANSEKQFIENTSTFLAGLDDLKEIAGRRFLGYSVDARLTQSASQPFNYWQGQLKFRICAL